MMHEKNGNYQVLINKLDRFTRKYYINKLIRGSLYSTGFILGLFLIFNLLEHQFFFSVPTRKILFYSFILSSFIALGFWVFLPLMNYFKLGKIISHEKAAEIIGVHFSDVKDKLLNILQLKKQADNSEQSALVYAGIDQKSEEIKLVSFRKAINLNQNRKYLKYSLPPLLLLLFLLFAAPSLIKDSAHRLINNNTVFEKAAPFSFNVENPELKVAQYEDFTLNVSVEGSLLPDQVFINLNNYQYRLKKVDASNFEYIFTNVQKDVDFTIFSGSVSSNELNLSVLEKPNIGSFDIALDYPSYTGRKDETIENIGDLNVPFGTTARWQFNTENTEQINVGFSGEEKEIIVDQVGNSSFSFKKRLLKSGNYKLYLSNEFLPLPDSVSYNISIIPDQYPSINAEKFTDSLNNKLLFFAGSSSDDYGLRNLSFNYRIIKADGTEHSLENQLINIEKSKEIKFDYSWDLNDIGLAPGDRVDYYFEIFDNDVITGGKSARTGLQSYRLPSLEEIEEKEKENNESIKENLKKSLDQNKKLQEKAKDIREKLLNKKKLDWQDKKELEKLLNQQKEMEKQLENAKDKLQENQKNQEEFKNLEEDTKDKQEKIEELFEELMDEEMKELMEKFEELMDKMEKDDALEMMEDFKFDSEEMEMELDRLLELFKQMELEMEMEEQIDKLNDLAEREEKLSEDTENENKSNEELQKEQEEIKEEFEKIEENLEDIQKKNQELEKPKDISDKKEEGADVKENMDKANQELQKQDNKKASKAQKKASQQMQQMANQMQQQMGSGKKEQMQEDMAALRQLLENLINLSFDQENLFEKFSRTNKHTPRYVGLVQNQFKLKDDFGLIQDSLHALSKRVVQIESFVTDKVTEVNQNMERSLTQLEERNTTQASDHQRRTMKNVNDLALMLSEVLQQMQNAMSSMMPGSQMCNNPGKSQGQGDSPGSVPSDKMGESQEGLNEKMGKMQKGQKEGRGVSSEEFAKMAREQRAVREALQKMKQMKDEQGEGKGASELQKIIDQMNQTETDLVNKRLNNEMLKRQKDILTRLLEAENAERERQQDNKRKSEMAKDYERNIPPSMEEYLKQREAEVELFKSVSPVLKPYYKNLVESYYRAIKTSNN